MTDVKKLPREYLIVHSLGVTAQRARSAAEAIKRAFVPLGFRDVFAVIERDLAATASGESQRGSAFCAFIGLAVSQGGQSA